MILFSGLLYDRNLVPMWLRWLEKVSIVNYGFAALILNQVGPSLHLHELMISERGWLSLGG